MRVIAVLLSVVAGVLLISATGSFPEFGDPRSPASTHVSPHYIEKVMEETSVPNIVTAVLGDYRSYDTMFEAVVVFTAGLGCFFLLRHRRGERTERFYRHLPTGMVIHVKEGRSIPPASRHFELMDSQWLPQSIIVRTIARLLTPFIQIYALYVVAHGHHSPGGGFQGGVILGASFLLLALSYDLAFVTKRFSESALSLCSALGLIIYAGIGLACLGLGLNFLDYSAMAQVLPFDPVTARSWGILFVEIGVALTVMSTMIIIYNNVASEGRYDEGL
ncbi:MAG: Na(+)/H(+) antiporter subunit B [Desulfohalobiaceae bacterium]